MPAASGIVRPASQAQADLDQRPARPVPDRVARAGALHVPPGQACLGAQFVGVLADHLLHLVRVHVLSPYISPKVRPRQALSAFRWCFGPAKPAQRVAGWTAVVTRTSPLSVRQFSVISAPLPSSAGSSSLLADPERGDRSR